MLINPFEMLSTGWNTMLASVVLVSEIAISISGLRFDGAMDLHQAGVRVPATLAIFDAANAILVATLAFWIAGWVVARRGRIVDFLLSVTIARIPLVLMGILTHETLPPPDKLLAAVTANPGGSPVIVFVALLTLPMIVWFIVMLYQGFRTSTGLRGPKTGIAFTIALLIAEVVTKFIPGILPA